MGRQKLENHSIRKIGKIAKTSYYITIPVELIRQLQWRLKQKVTVKRHRNGLLVQDWQEKKMP